jgi:hypothetical protein
VASERLAVVIDDFPGQSGVANINATKEIADGRRNDELSRARGNVIT